MCIFTVGSWTGYRHIHHALPTCDCTLNCPPGGLGGEYGVRHVVCTHDHLKWRATCPFLAQLGTKPAEPRAFAKTSAQRTVLWLSVLTSLAAVILEPYSLRYYYLLSNPLIGGPPSYGPAHWSPAQSHATLLAYHAPDRYRAAPHGIVDERSSNNGRTEHAVGCADMPGMVVWGRR